MNAGNQNHSLALSVTRIDDTLHKGLLGYHYTVRFIAPILFVLMLSYFANLKAIKYESTSLNRIVADKSYRVIVA